MWKQTLVTPHLPKHNLEIHYLKHPPSEEDLNARTKIISTEQTS